jgi:hypothetical protein
LNPEKVPQAGEREILWNPYRVRIFFCGLTQGGATLTLGYFV